MAGLKVKKGDRVVVLAGKDKGKEGDVSRVLPKEGKVIVDGINVVKRHQKPTSATMQGGIIDKDLPIPVSRIAIVSPEDGRPTRVGYRFEPDGTKVRICKRTGADLP
ncbi:MAG: 50S ribosomal protein L24 [Acidimicrobiia bacterium]|nr:50S ribosomal protein L24 [Acidimicrobiia bacterium]